MKNIQKNINISKQIISNNAPYAYAINAAANKENYEQFKVIPIWI